MKYGSLFQFGGLVCVVTSTEKSLSKFPASQQVVGLTYARLHFVC